MTVVCYDIFFFNDTATTEIYTLSLHDALPICGAMAASRGGGRTEPPFLWFAGVGGGRRRAHVGSARDLRPGHADRKSTRLNSSHANISYAVFCLKKKNIRTEAGVMYCNHNTTG